MLPLFTRPGSCVALAWRWLVVTFTVLLATLPGLRAQSLDFATRVPVTIVGTNAVLSEGADDDSVRVMLPGLTDPVTSQPYQAIGTHSTTLTVALEPGKAYDMICDGNGSGDVVESLVQISAPAGYIVEIDYIVRSVFNGSAKIRIFSERDRLVGPAGTASSIASGKVYWQVSLGYLQNGESAGSLAIIDSATGSWAELFTPAGLSLQASSSEVAPLAGLSQIVTNEAYVQTVSAPDNESYEIKFFNRKTTLRGPAPTYPLTGNPYVVYKVGKGATPSTLKIIRTDYDGDGDALAPTYETSVTRSLPDASKPGDFKWVLEDWHKTPASGAAVVPVTEIRDWVVSDGTRTETVTRKDVTPATGAVISSVVTNVYDLGLPWGTELISRKRGDSAELQPTQEDFSYHAVSTDVGNWSKQARRTSTSGGWEAFQYDATGRVIRRFKPYLDSPAAPPAAADPSTWDGALGEVVVSEYGSSSQDRKFDRVTASTNYVKGTTVAKATISYVDPTTGTSGTVNGMKFVTATRTEHTINGGATLPTVTKYFREDILDDLYRNRIHSIVQPDGVKQSFAYQRGYWDADAPGFTPTGSGGLNADFPSGDNRRGKVGSRTTVVTGVVGSGLTSLQGYAIDPIGLVEGKSTIEITIRDENAHVVVTETQAYMSGTWRTVAITYYHYDHANHLIRKDTSSGTTYGAVYEGGRLKSATDQNGVKVTYDYDAAGRVLTAQKEGGATTTLAYDADNHVLSQTVGSGASAIQNRWSFDTAGRLVTETAAGQNPVSYAYDVTARTRTTTLKPTANAVDNTTRTETFHRDGRLKNIEGTAVVGSHYFYGVESDGRQWVEARSGEAESARRTKTWTDWLGRIESRVSPGFAPPGLEAQADFTETYTYGTTADQPSRGHLTKVEKTGYAAEFYVYDSMATVNRTVVDVSGNGLIDLDGGAPAATPWLSDIVTDFERKFVFDTTTNAPWLTEERKIYPFAASATAKSASKFRRRLGNVVEIDPKRRDVTESTDAEGNVTTRTVDVDLVAKTMTVTTALPGIAGTQIETYVNGLPSSVTGNDGLTSRVEYDSLERLWKQTDVRNNVVTTSYYPGTTLIQSVVDGAGNTVATYGYDKLGRVISASNAEGRTTYQAYTTRGQLWRRWGSGTYPAEYGYDAVYGERTSQKTYRVEPPTGWNAAAWPGDPAPSTDATASDASKNPVSTTAWLYDVPTGLLWKKTDAATPAQQTEYRYNQRRQVAKRIGSRGLEASYAYDEKTGDLTDVTYNDTTATIPTGPINYTYNRLRQVDSVTDVTGKRTFGYNPTAPWRLAHETFDASFYGSRRITGLYEEETTVPAGGLSSVKGRSIGFELGIAATSGRDLSQRYAVTDIGRFGVVSSRAGGGVTRDFSYGYHVFDSTKPAAPLVAGYTVSPAVAGDPTFAVTRGYEAQRDVVTSVETKWGTATQTLFEYRYNPLGQRRTARQSGAAFSDYTGSAQVGVYNYYTYNARGELWQSVTYRGTLPAVNPATKDTPAPASADELVGRRTEFLYDPSGNRTSSGPTGLLIDPLTQGRTLDEVFSSNSLNQVTERENNSLRVLLASTGEAKVAMQTTEAMNPVPETKKTTSDPNAAGDIVPLNGAGPVHGELTVYARMPSTGSISSKQVSWFSPPARQVLRYDLDGNLSSDGVWDYTYDAENRLRRMTSVLPAGGGFTRLELDFKYDYLGRRVEKKVRNLDTADAPVTRRYLYHGWNLVAELDGGGTAIQRSYAWGLDIAGSLDATGGVGALLQITNWSGGSAGPSYYPACDANGNVAAVVRENGALAAVYEYAPFGEPLRLEKRDPELGDQPFRFSTKFHDAETGLVYYGHRYHSPALGRFINRDPLEEAGGNNLYAHTGNDPINRVDVLGGFPAPGSNWRDPNPNGRGGPPADDGYTDGPYWIPSDSFVYVDGFRREGGWEAGPYLEPRPSLNTRSAMNGDYIRQAKSFENAKLRGEIVTGRIEPNRGISEIAPNGVLLAHTVTVTSSTGAGNAPVGEALAQAGIRTGGSVLSRAGAVGMLATFVLMAPGDSRRVEETQNQRTARLAREHYEKRFGPIPKRGDPVSDLNLIRLQLQTGDKNILSYMAVNRPEIGVGAVQVQMLLAVMYAESKFVPGFPSDSRDYLQKTIEMSVYINGFVPRGIAEEKNIGRKDFREDGVVYRIDVENKRGWNLRW